MDARSYYLKHKPEIDERNKQNYYKNRTYVRAYQQKYYETHKFPTNSPFHYFKVRVEEIFISF